MDTILKQAFDRLGVEYYSAIAYEHCLSIHSELLERAELIPSTVIIYLLPYYAGKGENLSAYATSLDYHIALREISSEVISELKRNYPEYKFCGFGDHSPINERDTALKCGLGILGDNGLLINERYGSYIFIGEIITDAPPNLLGAVDPMPYKHCHSCGACRKACPTGILRGDGSECLSEITQRKGELDDNSVEMMRKFNTVWGCDVCQSVCPYNQSPVITPIPFFLENRIEFLSTDIVNALSKDDFMKRAFAWRGKRTVLRNLEYLKY